MARSGDSQQGKLMVRRGKLGLCDVEIGAWAALYENHDGACEVQNPIRVSTNMCMIMGLFRWMWW